MMLERGQLAQIIPSVILLAGVANDLYSRKVKNWLVLVCLALAAVSAWLMDGPVGLVTGGLGALAGFGLLVPFVLMGILGAGDMKIMVAFGMATNYQIVLEVVLYSVLWGAVLGFMRSVLAGQGLTLIRNTAAIIFRWYKPEKQEMHKIPYTIALFLGWVCSLTLHHYGVEI